MTFPEAAWTRWPRLSWRSSSNAFPHSAKTMHLPGLRGTQGTHFETFWQLLTFARVTKITKTTDKIVSGFDDHMSKCQTRTCRFSLVDPTYMWFCALEVWCCSCRNHKDQYAEVRATYLHLSSHKRIAHRLLVDMDTRSPRWCRIGFGKLTLSLHVHCLPNLFETLLSM